MSIRREVNNLKNMRSRITQQRDVHTNRDSQRDSSIDSDTMGSCEPVSKIAFAGVCATIILVPLFFSPWLIQTTSIKRLAFHLILAMFGCAIALYSLYALSTRKAPTLVAPQTGFWFALLAYSAWNLISIFYSPHLLSAFAEFERVASLVLIFWLTWLAIRPPNRAEVVLNIFVYVAVALGFVAILQASGVLPARMDSRVSATMGNPNLFAAYLVMILPIVASMFLTRKRVISAIASATVYAFLFLSMIFTGTRSAIIGLAATLVCVTCYSLISAKHDKSRSPIVRITIILLISVLISVSTMRISVSPFRRFAVLFDQIESASQNESFADEKIQTDAPEKKSDSVNVYATPRLAIWTATIEMIKQRPIIGWGAGSFQLVFPSYRSPDFKRHHLTNNTDHAHNEYLEISATIGVVGVLIACIAMVYFVLPVGKKLRRGSKPDDTRLRTMMIGCVAGIFGALIHAVTSVSLRWIDPSVTLFILLAIALRYAEDETHRKEITKQRFSHSPAWLQIGVTALFITLFSIYAVRSIRTYVSEELYANAREDIEGKHYASASAHLRNAIRYNAITLRPRYALGYVEARGGDYDEAVSAYLDLQRIAPHYADVHENLAGAFLKLGNASAALDEATIALSMNRITSNFLKLGIIAYLSGDPDRANEALIEATQRDQNLGQAWVYLGDVAIARKEWQTAVEAYTRGLTLELSGVDRIRAERNLRLLGDAN
jgi:O-antigen ligase